MMVIEETAHGAIDQTEDECESVITTVVGVGDVIMIRFGVVLHQRPYLLRRTPEIEEIADILLVHADQKTVMIEVISSHLTRSGDQIDPMTLGDRPASGVGRITRVPSSNSRRVDFIVTVE